MVGSKGFSTREVMPMPCAEGYSAVATEAALGYVQFDCAIAFANTMPLPAKESIKGLVGELYPA